MNNRILWFILFFLIVLLILFFALRQGGDISGMTISSLDDEDIGIGPFDFSLNIQTKILNSGEKFPIVLNMVNQGQEGSEVLIRTELYCENKIVKDEFSIFLESEREMEKTIYMDACSEKGIKTISSDLILNGILIISSSSQILVE